MGTEEQRQSEYRGTVGKEGEWEQSNIGYRGTACIEEQRYSGSKGTADTDE